MFARSARSRAAARHTVSGRVSAVHLRVAVYLLVTASLLVASCSSDEPASPQSSSPDRMVDIGSHSLHARVVGRGAPAVVIDGGIGALGDEYRALQDRLAATTTVVAYDRAGYGSSEPGPLPRDSRTEAAELRALLSGLRIPGPYVIVGHSLGGLNAQVFADLYRDEVAGMVLLDPPPLGFILRNEYVNLVTMADRMTDEWQAIADRGLRTQDERGEGIFFQMLASEHREMFGVSAEQASSIGSFGEVPLCVVASGVPNEGFGPDAGPYQLFWAAESEALAGKSTRGRFVFAEESTHRLHEDASELVTDCILSVVESLR